MFRTVVICAALAMPASAFARDEARAEGAIEDESILIADRRIESPDLVFAGSVDLLSDYRFRGVSRSEEDPAAQAAVTLSHDTGLYSGLRGTTLKGTDGFRLRDPAFQGLGDVELDLYAGWRTDLGGGFDLDAGLLYYVFAGGDGATDYAEPYASLSYLIGPLYATAGAKYAPSQAAIGKEDQLYLFGQVDVTVPMQPWRFSALVGHQDWSRFGDYWTWSLGVTRQLRLGALPDAEIGLRYVDTDLAAPGADATAVASIGFVF